MTLDQGFYAYIHCRPDGTPFYVGKGRGRRANVVKRVNRWHSHIVASDGAHNILIGKLDCSSEAIAFELEKGLIKCLKRMGHTLVNMTAGGEGSTGYVSSPESRRKQSEKLRGIKRSDEFREKMRVVGKARGVPEATIAAAKVANTGRIHTPEEKEKRAAANRGAVRSEETKARIAESIRKWHAKNPQHGEALSKRNRSR